jgi:hypothetical protein
LNRYDISRSDLKIDLVAVVFDLIRDIQASLKNTRLYPPEHQAVAKLLEKPYGQFEKIFKLKTELALEISDGQVLAEGVFIPNDPFIHQFSEVMQKKRLSNMVFYDSLTSDQMNRIFSALFEKRLVDPSFQNFLKKNGIFSAEVNVSHPSRLYGPAGIEYFEDDPRFIVESRIKELLSGNLVHSIASKIGVPDDDKKVIANYGFDLRVKAMELIAEDILPKTDLAEIVREFGNLLSERKELLRSSRLEIGKIIKKFIDYVGTIHNKSEAIISFRQVFAERGLSLEDVSELFGDVGTAHLKVVDGADRMTLIIRSGNIDNEFAAEYMADLTKLIDGDLWEGIEEMLNSLLSNVRIEHCDDSNPGCVLAKQAVQKMLTDTGGDLYIKFIDYLEKWGRGENKNEAAAVITAFALDKLIRLRRYDDAFKLASLFGPCTDGGFVESIGEKYRPQLIDEEMAFNIVDDFVNSPKKDRRVIAELAVVIGSSILAEKLLPYINYPDKDLRSQIIKIMVATGEKCIPVMEKYMESSISFSRKDDHSSLIDDEWYTIRNIITVTCKLESERGLPILEKLAGDPDERVRLEVAKSLEHIPGKPAIDRLIRFYNDSSARVRDASIISTGLSGDDYAREVLIGLIESGSGLWHQALTALSYIKSAEVDQLLLKLYRDEGYLAGHGFKEIDFENIKELAAAILEKRGNQEYMKSKSRRSKSRFSLF